MSHVRIVTMSMADLTCMLVNLFHKNTGSLELLDHRRWKMKRAVALLEEYMYYCAPPPVLLLGTFYLLSEINQTQKQKGGLYHCIQHTGTIDTFLWLQSSKMLKLYPLHRKHINFH